MNRSDLTKVEVFYLPTIEVPAKIIKSALAFDHHWKTSVLPKLPLNHSHPKKLVIPPSQGSLAKGLYLLIDPLFEVSHEFKLYFLSQPASKGHGLGLSGEDFLMELSYRLILQLD